MTDEEKSTAGITSGKDITCFDDHFNETILSQLVTSCRLDGRPTLLPGRSKCNHIEVVACIGIAIPPCIADQISSPLFNVALAKTLVAMVHARRQMECPAVAQESVQSSPLASIPALLLPFDHGTVCDILDAKEKSHQVGHPWDFKLVHSYVGLDDHEGIMSEPSFMVGAENNLGHDK